MSVAITKLTADRIPSAMQLVSIAGWNQTPDDWRRVIAYQPDGCFCALVEDQVVGTVTTTCYGDELAWIGMMLVHPDMRRRGIGQSLMERAIEMLQSRRMQIIGLDATPAGRPLYERLGFRAIWDFQRWQRASTQVTDSASTRLPEPKPSLTQHFEGLSNEESSLQLDKRAFGVDRRAWLKSVARDSIAMKSVQDGFGMLRCGRIADYLGPIVASSSATATEIMESLIKTTQRTLLWDMIQEDDALRGFAGQHGFQPTRVLTRMLLGQAALPGQIVHQYAICDPASG